MIRSAIQRSLIPTFLIAMLTKPIFSAPLEAPPKTINLASTNWCPYVCDSPSRPGYVVEYMRALLKLKNTTLQVTILPWSRAIEMSRQGHFDGLLTAVEAEAPDFILTRQKIDDYQMCFYRLSNSTFRYEDRASLKNRHFAAIQDYGYGKPIDDVISATKDNERVTLINSSKPIQSMSGMLRLKRIDAFIGDSAVITRYLQEHRSDETIEQAGCLAKVPFFLAVSPTTKRHSAILERIEDVLSDDRAPDLLLKAKQHYGLTPH